MRYHITVRDESSGSPVDPFVVEAENEEDARNRAAELGVKIDSVQLAPALTPAEADRPPACCSGSASARSSPWS